jgi:hypothetical protein
VYVNEQGTNEWIPCIDHLLYFTLTLLYFLYTHYPSILSVLFFIFSTLPCLVGGSHDMKALCFLASCGRQGYVHSVVKMENATC